MYRTYLIQFIKQDRDIVFIYLRMKLHYFGFSLILFLKDHQTFSNQVSILILVNSLVNENSLYNNIFI